MQQFAVTDGQAGPQDPLLDGLRQDGSWTFTWRHGFLDEARFAPAADSRPGRRALVERLLAEHPHASAADPEQWEGAHSVELAARSLAARPRPRLEHLRFGYRFEHLYEDSATSTGGRIDPMEYHGHALVRTSPWDALPGLRTLDLEGAFLFDSVDHQGLTRLRVRGPATSDGAVFDLGRTPGVVSLAVVME
ncbi:hypothetical protein OH807_01685 [Kitasatospora sp. NBC_01560]|uniref:hypothetical protein n=1 Tax=Kitasatospora sp. NBC_01560 TaxID=2975965 RepID=UPI003863BAB4